VVAVAATTGGLEAFRALLAALPASSGMAFILVQHLDPTHPSMLVDLLSPHTNMPVLEARQDMWLEPDHVIIISPGHFLAVSDGALRVYGEVSGSSAAGALAAHLDTARTGDYVALMAYVTPDEDNQRALQRLRVAIRDTRHLATTLGFGPRFLHSTGQLHKGGPNTGVYIQVTADDGTDVPIPGQPFTFSVLKRAQAAGDLQSLRDHGRRVVRVHIAGDLGAGLASLTDAVGAITAAR